MIVTKRGSGTRWTRQCRARRRWRGGINSVSDRPIAQTDGIAAYGKIVWTRRPLLASSLAEVRRARPGRGAGFRQATEARQRMTPG
jgi:hypothetical protein